MDGSSARSGAASRLHIPFGEASLNRPSQCRAQGSAIDAARARALLPAVYLLPCFLLAHLLSVSTHIFLALTCAPHSGIALDVHGGVHSSASCSIENVHGGTILRYDPATSPSRLCAYTYTNGRPPSHCVFICSLKLPSRYISQALPSPWAGSPSRRSV
jgi:hypothetical protein